MNNLQEKLELYLDITNDEQFSAMNKVVEIRAVMTTFQGCAQLLIKSRVFMGYYYRYLNQILKYRPDKSNRSKEWDALLQYGCFVTKNALDFSQKVSDFLALFILLRDSISFFFVSAEKNNANGNITYSMQYLAKDIEKFEILRKEIEKLAKEFKTETLKTIEMIQNEMNGQNSHLTQLQQLKTEKKDYNDAKKQFEDWNATNFASIMEEKFKAAKMQAIIVEAKLQIAFFNGKVVDLKKELNELNKQVQQYRNKARSSRNYRQELWYQKTSTKYEEYYRNIYIGDRDDYSISAHEYETDINVKQYGMDDAHKSECNWQNKLTENEKSIPPQKEKVKELKKKYKEEKKQKETALKMKLKKN